MDILFTAFVVYGLCFGLMNKLPFLYSKKFMETGEKSSFMDKLLSCSYCMGFHCGWVVYGGFWFISGASAPTWATPVQALACAFAAAAWCYAADTVIQRLESD